MPARTDHEGIRGIWKIRRAAAMTRQKKEIIKKIDEIEMFIAADEELGCGFAPADIGTVYH